LLDYSTSGREYRGREYYDLRRRGSALYIEKSESKKSEKIRLDMGPCAPFPDVKFLTPVAIW